MISIHAPLYPDPRSSVFVVTTADMPIGSGAILSGTISVGDGPGGCGRTSYTAYEILYGGREEKSSPGDEEEKQWGDLSKRTFKRWADENDE